MPLSQLLPWLPLLPLFSSNYNIVAFVMVVANLIMAPVAAIEDSCCRGHTMTTTAGGFMIAIVAILLCAGGCTMTTTVAPLLCAGGQQKTITFAIATMASFVAIKYSCCRGHTMTTTVAPLLCAGGYQKKIIVAIATICCVQVALP
jgi:uncharacterized membrane protein